MKILFSPSEGKIAGGEQAPLNKHSLVFEQHYDKRLQVLKQYNDFILHADDDALSKIFGLKKLAQCALYKRDLFNSPTMKAIERYNGVAYEYLTYARLDQQAQDYLDKNTLIFSNLFGPILASDTIPEYKLKQGEKIDTLATEKFYKDNFSTALDQYLENEPIIDMRAGYYNKFYKVTQEYITLKFIKEGKVVSHWAKAYRGIVLKTLATNNIQTIEEFYNVKIEGLSYNSKITKKNHTEIIYDILTT